MSNLSLYSPYDGRDEVHQTHGLGLSISHVGSGTISLPGKKFHLSSVLCVPSAKNNLISVYHLYSSYQVSIELFFDYFLVNDQFTGEIQFKAHMIDPCTSFYHLQFQINLLSSTFDFHQILVINILAIPILGSLISFFLSLGCQHLLLKHHLVIIVNAIKFIVDPLVFLL